MKATCDFVTENLSNNRYPIKNEGVRIMNTIYDMLIIGGGPGGYTAALYAARAGMTVLVLEKLSAGVKWR